MTEKNIYQQRSNRFPQITFLGAERRGSERRINIDRRQANLTQYEVIRMFSDPADGGEILPVTFLTEESAIEFAKRAIEKAKPGRANFCVRPKINQRKTNGGELEEDSLAVSLIAEFDERRAPVGRRRNVNVEESK